MASALYTGHVRHHRLAPEHSFRYRTTMCLLDLDEIEEVMARHPLWSTDRGRPVQYRRTDFLGDPSVELKTAVRQEVEAVRGPIGDGQILLLTQLRTWGWCFNPISIYYCFDAEGALTTAVASVSNTPWGQRHDYVLEAAGGRIETCAPKSLHVSPFFGMEQAYRFLLSSPGERLHARIDVLERGAVRLATSLHLARAPLDRPAMTALLTSPPFMAWRVSAAIYWQAFRLWRAGAQFHPHPRVAARRRPGA